MVVMEALRRHLVRGQNLRLCFSTIEPLKPWGALLRFSTARNVSHVGSDAESGPGSSGGVDTFECSSYTGRGSGEVRSLGWFATTAPRLRMYMSNRLSRVYPKVNRVKRQEDDDAMPFEKGHFRPPNLERKRLSQIDMKETTKAIILGTLLGDGSLRILKGAKCSTQIFTMYTQNFQHYQVKSMHPPLGADEVSGSKGSLTLPCMMKVMVRYLAEGETDARLSFRHSQTHEEYFQWKAAAMKEISSKNAVYFGQNKKFLFQSQSMNPLTKIHEVTHDHNRLFIRRRWLNHLTPQSLAIWWCDAGSLVAGGRKGVLCTDFFPEDRVVLLAQYLEVRWNVQAHVGAVKRLRKDRDNKEFPYYRLWFRTEELKKLLRIVLPHIPVASMIRKCFIIYNDKGFQESWVAEMKSALPHLAMFIDEELANVRQIRTRIILGAPENEAIPASKARSLC